LIASLDQKSFNFALSIPAGTYVILWSALAETLERSKSSILESFKTLTNLSIKCYYEVNNFSRVSWCKLMFIIIPTE
jgi:hypothetical protein